jgi:hypothetical protein
MLEVIDADRGRIMLGPINRSRWRIRFQRWRGCWLRMETMVVLAKEREMVVGANNKGGNEYGKGLVSSPQR